MSGQRTYLSLSGPRRFNAVFTDGKRVRSGGVTIVASARDTGSTRVGLVAGRRVGGAVVRNRAKRRLRAALDRIDLPDRIDVVVIASPSVSTAPFTDVERWVEDGITRATQAHSA